MSVSAKVRAKSGTVKDPKTGKKTKFPEQDKKHARLAIQFESKAKPALTPEQKHDVEVRAAKFGVGPLAKKNKAKKSK